MNKSVFAVGAAVGCAVLSLQAQELRELTFQVAMPVKTAPVVDGALDDACWKEAVVHDRYYEYIKPNPKRVQLKTECRIIYDEKGLYTGITNWEKFPGKLRRNVTKNCQGDTWHDDCAELYYDPDASGAGYYRFVVNANGKVDPDWRMDAANVDRNWNPDGLKAAAKVFDDRWEFELFIPWTAFHNRPMPEPGNIWTFNHARYRYTEKSYWDFSTSAPGGSGISPRKFGYLYFSDGKKPNAEAVLALLQHRLQTIWAIEIDGKTYLRDLKGITTMDESVPEFIAKREAEAKASAEAYEAKLAAMTNLASKAEKIDLPVAGTYDLNPPKEYNGYNGWFRHNRIKDAYVTPHLDWRSPLTKKKPRVLFLTNFGWGFRDAIELEQRFDIEALFFPGNFGESGVYKDPVSLGTHLDKQRQFETLLAKDPDVFVFSTFRWSEVPARYRYEIVRRVRDEGKGLVFFGDRPGKMLDKLPKDLMAAKAFASRLPSEPKTKSDFYLFGKGRIVCAPAYKLGAWSLAFRGLYETRAAQRITPILWASHIDDEVRVRFASGSDRETLAPEAEFISFVMTGKDKWTSVAWRVRNQSAEVVLEGKAKLGNSATTVPVKDLPPGEYVLDILDALPIAHPFTRLAPVGEFTVNSTNEILIAENGPVDLKVAWEKPVAEPARLEWEIFDMPYRQVRDKGVFKVGKGGRTAAIRRAAGPFPTLAGFVRAKLVAEDGSVLAALDKMMFFPNHRFPDYTMTIWESLFDSGMLELLAPQCIDKMGYDNHLGESGSNSAVFNGRAVPYVTRVMLNGTTNGTTWAKHVLPMPAGKTKEEKEYYDNLRKDVNIYKPEVRAAIEEQFANKIKNTVKYGVSCWNLGDECHYSDNIGFGDAASEKLYRTFLAERYGTIDHFNAEHGTVYKNFDEAPHKLVSDAKKEGDWPSLGDQKAYAAKMYSDTFQLLRGVIKKFDPKARVGAEGSEAGDLEQTVENLEFWGPYRNLVQDELVRNIAPDRVRGIWWGGYLSDPRNGFPMGQWEFLLTGTLNGDLWFAAMPGGTHSAFAGDYTLAPYVQKMHANHAQLKRGLASLLIRTPFAYQPFTFYYSHESKVASTLSDEFPVPNEGLLSYFRFCYRYGYDINITTAKTIAKLKDKKLLFLCGASALSDAEVKAFKEFVKGGGEIISDCEPGVLDNFLARRSDNVDADTKHNVDADTKHNVDAESLPRQKKDNSAFGRGKDSASTGKPLDGMWTRLDRKWTDEQVQAMLAKKGIQPQAAVKGLDLDHTILRVRANGDMRLVGFKTLAKFVGQPVTLDLGAKGAIYECDAGYVGEGDKVEIAALDRPFKLYAVFATKQSVPQVELSAVVGRDLRARRHDEPLTIAPGDTVTLATAPLRKGSVYRLMVKKNGAEIKNREQVFAADGKPLSFQFPYSDEPGSYTVVVRDIATGLEGTADVTLVSAATLAASPATIKLDLSKTGHEIPKTLWGGFFEDYDFGADGGLYPELVANRGFDLECAPKYGWTDDFRGVDARVSIQHGRPVHPNTAAHVRIERAKGPAGALAGVKNLGYFGMGVKQDAKYDLSLYLRGLDGYPGEVKVVLESKGKTLAEASFPASAFKVGAKRTGMDYELPDWTKLSAVLTPNATAADATLSVLLTDRGAVEADFVSLYPQDTYKGRKNGLRRDLAEMLEALKPAFLRFPGGCMLEGHDFQQWCDWKRTVGPLERRECVEGLWSWIATHGLGYYEYFLMCEDMKMEPLPVLIGGVTCQFRGTKRWPMEGMDELAKNTLDLIEFANGDASTTWGSVRASMGHPKPFDMKMLAIGNENWGEEYLSRYDILEKAVKAKYPKLQLVPSYGAGVDIDGWRKAKQHFAGRSDLIVDEHYYQPADWFFKNADRYDAYDRKGPKIFIGEYASFDRIGGKCRCCLENALGEAALMTGYERNCDVVVMAAFAPMYMRYVAEPQEFFNGRTYSSAWPGSMIWFDGLRAFGRTSYWVQKLFANNRPDVLVPFAQDVPRSREGLYTVCGLDRAKNELVVKVVNPAGARPLTLEFAAALPAGTVRVETLANNDLFAENTLEAPTKVVPIARNVGYAGGSLLQLDLSEFSLTVIRIPLR